MIDRSANAASRARIVDQLRPATTAWSIDGREVEFVAAFELAARPGDLLVLTTGDGRRLLAQAHDVRVGTRRGIAVDVDPDALGVDGVHGATVDLTVRVVEGTGIVLDPLDGDPSEIGPFDDATVERADGAVVAAYAHRALGSRLGLQIGNLLGSQVPAHLRASGFARHTFMCGQSGSGKTYSLGVVLERLLHDTELPVVVIDPNSDYVNLGRVASRSAVNRTAPTPLSRAEHAALRDRYLDRAGVVVASARGGDLPLKIHLSDLTLHEQALAMQLDPIDDPDEYHALVEATNALDGAPYDAATLSEALLADFDEASRRLARRIANLSLAHWPVWARSDEPSLTAAAIGHRAVVLDTGSLASAHERSVVALALLGRLRRRSQRQPVCVVIERAHNVCPPDARSLLDQAVTDLALWIAGEGRKYGIYLLLSTQRPQKIHRNVLSQCDNLLLMRVNSATDVEELTAVFSHVPAPLIRQARTHRMGEMLAAGPIAPTPLHLQVGGRWTEEGGADLPTSWATPRG